MIKKILLLVVLSVVLQPRFIGAEEQSEGKVIQLERITCVPVRLRRL